MTLIDTSAWIEFLRDTGSDACIAVDALLGEPHSTCDPVVMEVLAGARDEQHLARLRGLMGRASTLPTSPEHYDAAAGLYRTCRRNGETVRKLIDCLIAAIAIDAGVALLHHDSDFTNLARHTELRVHPGSISADR